MNSIYSMLNLSMCSVLFYSHIRESGEVLETRHTSVIAIRFV